LDARDDASDNPADSRIRYYNPGRHEGCLASFGAWFTKSSGLNLFCRFAENWFIVIKKINFEICKIRNLSFSGFQFGPPIFYAKIVFLSLFPQVDTGAVCCFARRRSTETDLLRKAPGAGTALQGVVFSLVAGTPLRHRLPTDAPGLLGQVLHPRQELTCAMHIGF
jgi:hypothetical protein